MTKPTKIQFCGGERQNMNSDELLKVDILRMNIIGSVGITVIFIDFVIGGIAISLGTPNILYAMVLVFVVHIFSLFGMLNAIAIE